jgi:hypothetical protein
LMQNLRIKREARRKKGIKAGYPPADYKMGLKTSSLKLYSQSPGLIGIASSTMGRYREFDISLNTVQKVPRTAITWETGCDVAFNFNNLCRKLLKNEGLQWLWILGDDHIFKPDILTRLLERDVDIVAPLCLKRSRPFLPVTYSSKYTSQGEQYCQIDWDYLKGKEGLIEVSAVGNAGMLVKRSVIKKMADDWHRVGWYIPEHGGSDLYFCKRATEEGFKIHVDLDNSIGHIAHMAVWPVKQNGEYSAGIREALDIPGEEIDKVDDVTVGD